MRTSRRRTSALTWVTLLSLVAAMILLVLQLVVFSRQRASYPNGLTIASVPVGGLDRTEAAETLLQAFNVPVELLYGGNRIHLDPAVVDFQLDLDSMLAAADQVRTEQNFWLDFWDYLWRQRAVNADVPLRAAFSEQRLRSFLSGDVAARYDQPPIPAQPAVGTVNFQPGEAGSTLDIDRSVTLIENGLNSLYPRVVDLPLKRTNAPRPSMANLEVLLKQTIDLSGFDGLSGMYLLDLASGQEIDFLYQQGEDLPTIPDASFTAASIIKIPIMVSAFSRLGGDMDPETADMMFKMIDLSGNEASDWIMDRVITTGSLPGPLGVTEDMSRLGLKNTFLAGYFAPGSPLLQVIETPGNSRPDLDTDPDPYSQTSLTDMGILLSDLYHCANQGGGTLIAAYGDRITSEECQTMLDYLSRNKIGVLIEAGAPDGTRIAHKHGWVSDIYGIIRTVADAGIVYSPGGNYVLVIFLAHPEQIIWDPASELVGELSEAVYNYYNIQQ